MNEQAINDLYNLAKQNGYSKSLDEFVNLMYTNDNAFNDMYSLAKSNGYQKSQDDFSVLIGKKKSVAQPQPTEQAQPMAQKLQAPAATASSSGAPSSALPSTEVRVEEFKGFDEETLKRMKASATEAPQMALMRHEKKAEKQREEDRAQVLAEIETWKDYKEQPYFEGELGNTIRAIPFGIGDFIDDIGRAYGAGSTQADIASPSNSLMISGPSSSPEQIKKYVEAAKALNKYGPSEEMVAFTKAIEEDNGGVWGFIKGLIQNPSIAPEAMLSSTRALFNSASAATAGTVVGGSAAGGAVFGGVGAGPAALASIPYAMGAAGATLETASSFAEFMNEELQKRGLELSEENVKTILEDENALSSMRNRALTRGVTIGVIDAFTGRVAGRVGAKLGKGVGTAAKIKAGLASSGIEAIGGAGGEATARALVGQEMDIAEIGLEGIGEMPMATIDVAAEVLRSPRYKINGEVRSAEDVKNIINTASAEELQKINFDIKNDRNGFNQQIQDKIVTNQVRNEIKGASPDIDDESLDQLTTLEMELRKVEGNKTQTGRDKANQIRSQIREVQQAAAEKKAAAPSEAPSAAPSITYDQLSDEAKALVEREVDLYQSNIDAAKENNREPDERDVNQLELLKSDPITFLEELVSTTTNEERKTLAEQALTKIKEEQDAIQKQTAGQVPVQPTARPSEEVAAGEPQAKPQEAAQAGVEEEVSRLEQAFGTAFAEPERLMPTSVETSTLEAIPTEQKMELTFTQEDGTITPLMGNEQMVSDMYKKAMAVPEAQRTPAQKSVIDVVKVSLGTPATPSGVSVSNKAQVAALETKTTAPEKKGIIKAATTAINTLKSIFPDMDIVIHDNEGSYDAQMAQVKGGKGSAGNFAVFRDANGKIVSGRIDINLSRANMRTVAHEVAHAVMLKAFGDNPALFKVFRDRITKILSETNVKALDDFASEYSETDSHQEFLVELSAALTESQEQLKPSTVQKIAELINKVVSKITGGKVQPFSGTVQTKELIDFLNTMSSAIGKGEAIQVKEGVTTGAAGVVSKSQKEGIQPKTREEVEAALSRGDRVIATLEMDEEPMEINSMSMVDRVDLNTMLIIPKTIVSKSQKKEITKFAEDEKGKIRPEQGGDRTGRYSSGNLAPLTGAPSFQGARGPDPQLVAVAEKYAEENGIDLKRQAEYVSVNEDRARRIADAFENMVHNPNDPKVREAYADLIAQTKKQYQALADAGYVFGFFDGDTDPYDGNPVNAMRDLRNNKKMDVFGTYAGYGTEGITKQERENNPMLEDTGLRWKDQNGVEHPVTANDLFRAVHDAFGHGLEGAGFRARGEENAWQAHVRLFTGPAVAAITTETRGQNSWINYGPYGEQNRNAKVQDTVFADNKIGLMPEWTWTEGRAENMPTVTSKSQVADEVKEMGETFVVSKSQKTPSEIQKVIKDARAQGFSEEAIKAFLVKKGFTAQEADTFMSKPEAGKKIELGEELMEGYDRMMAEVDGIIEKGLNRKTSQEKIMENVLAYVQGSKAYENATDQQREQIVREVKQAFGEKMKAAPSVGKILGKQIDKVTMTEMSLLKKQLKDLARGARDAKTAISNGTKAVTEMLNKMVKSGSISSAQLKTIIKKFGSLNVLNEKSLNRFIDYMTKVIADADYSSKLENAQSLRKAIKKLSRNKDKNASMRDLAKKFADIDPSLVDDIDAYNEIAQKIKESVKGSTIREGKITQAEMVNIEDSNEYINDTMEAQRQKLFDEKAAEIQEMLGVDVSDLSYEQLLEMVDKKEKITKYNEGLVRSAIIRMFGTYSSIIEQMFSTSKDPFTGEDIDIDPKKKELVQRFMDMDLNQLTAKQGLEAVDALTNFIQNGSTAKMEAVVSEYTGEKNAMELEEKGIKSEPLKAYFSKGIGRFFAEQFMSLPVMLERMFKGIKRASLFEKMSGLIDLRNKKSDADRKVTDIINDYVDKFYKEKANGEDFNTSYNATERGLVAFMTRNVVGTAKQMAEEFSRRKALIEESIEVLSKGTDAEKAKAELYQKAYDKLLKNSNNGDEVRSNADSKNLEAIDYWKNKWAEIYDDLSDVSENVYNTLLDKDSNYTPDRFTRLDSAGERTPLENDQSMFHGNTNTIYKKKTGVLMETERPKQLPRFEGKKKAGMYVDLSFDRNNANSMYDALVDINTAATIRQVEAFINSESFDSIIDNPKDAKLLKGRIQQFVRNMRDKNIVESDELSKAARSLNVMATIGIGQALGGIFQPFKQTIPVIVNTMINAGKINMSIPFNTAVNDFLNKSGYAIANRGLASTTELSSIEKLAELAESSKGEKLVKAIEAANKKMLEILLVKADVAVARASWIAYYEKSLQEQGIDTKGIDYSTHELNKEAADYAQRMVDRQQNISDHDLAGKMFTSKTPMNQIFVKAVMPFASFRINQWMRMTTDLSTLKSKTATKEDKRIAARSLAGFTAEMLTFKLISLGIIVLMGTLTKALMGHDEDEEEEKKRIDNVKKGQLTSTITDVFSPLPFLDKPIQAGAGWLLNKVQDIMGVAEEEKTTIFEPKKSDFISSLGAFGISTERIMQIVDLVGLSTNGKFKDDYGNEKQLSEEDMDVLKNMLGLAVLSTVGLAPAEVNTIVRNSIKFAKKNAKTEKSIEAEKFKPPHGLTKEQFKRYFPDEYEEMYGEGSVYYKMTKPEREQKKKVEDEKQKLMDEYYNYQKKSKKDSFGSDGFGEEKQEKDTFGSKGFGEED